MNQMRRFKAGAVSQSGELQLAMGDWVSGLADWLVFATFTFRWVSSVWSAERVYTRFMVKQHELVGGDERVTWDLRCVDNFFAIEPNPSRDGHHVHAVWANCAHIVRRDCWREWFHAYGRCRIEPVKNKDDVADYVGKYVVKGACWWNVRMVNQRELGFKK